MSEKTLPAELPEKYRKPVPETRREVSSLQIGDSGWVAKSAIHIDKEWRVWINANAPAIFAEPGRKPSDEWPICLERTEGGFSVRLNLAAIEFARDSGDSPVRNRYEGLLPAVEVF